MVPRVQIKKLRANAIVPRYMSELAAGLDLAAAIPETLTIPPHTWQTIGTGLAFALPPGYEGQVRPRSGLARNFGVTLVNAPGTLDADYTGELMIMLINHGDKPVIIEPGHRIAQLVIAPVLQAELVEVDELAPTDRGSGGFGSTGR